MLGASWGKRHLPARLRGQQRWRCRLAQQASFLHISSTRASPASLGASAGQDVLSLPSRPSQGSTDKWGQIWGPRWVKHFIFISIDTHSCVCSSDFRGLPTAMGVLCLVWANCLTHWVLWTQVTGWRAALRGLWIKARRVAFSMSFGSLLFTMTVTYM